MTHPPQIRIPATYMRGGTSKGVFFRLEDLPEAARVPGPARDALLLRVIGSPDPYGKHTDGMGGATSSTSKTVILSRSPSQPGHDVDYLFGQVSIDQPFIDWSGNCGNLTAAVGSFAISQGPGGQGPGRIPEDGHLRPCASGRPTSARPSWPMCRSPAGKVQETGDFELDGVTFPAAEVAIDFLAPTGARAGAADRYARSTNSRRPATACVTASFVSAGIPTIFVDAADELGFDGTRAPVQPSTTIRALLEPGWKCCAPAAVRLPWA
jgi:2-methylaconitate isomerase